jgi:hypothetical protein
MPRFIDRTDQRFGWLVVLERAGTHTPTEYFCECDCGRMTCVLANNLVRGLTTSCGCRRDAATAERSTTHGHSRGRKHSPEYQAWNGMLMRCHNPADRVYPNYGARGIKVCEEWRASFEAFLHYVGTRPSGSHSLDRIDNERGYEPGNVRWATKRQQMMNRRTTITVDGRHIQDIAREYGVREGTLYMAHRRGQDVMKTAKRLSHR